MSDDDEQEAAHLQGGNASRIFAGVACQLRDLTGAEKVFVIALKGTRTGEDAVISGMAGMNREDVVPALNYCIAMFKSDAAVMISPKADA